MVFLRDVERARRPQSRNGKYHIGRFKAKESSAFVQPSRPPPVESLRERRASNWCYFKGLLKGILKPGT